MLLKEFFGPAISVGKKQLDNNSDVATQDDDLFWFIVNHDRLHKDYFMPLARTFKKRHAENNVNESQCIKEFMPMVKKGCMEYYSKNKLEGKAEKLFPKELRERMCQRLYDHYYEDVINDSYNLGEW